MLRLPTLGGQAQLQLFVDDLSRDLTLQILGVSERTLRRWLSGDSEIPAMAWPALFWFTRWGESEICCQYDYENLTLRHLVAARAGDLVQLAVLPAANDGRPVLQLVQRDHA